LGWRIGLGRLRDYADYVNIFLLAKHLYGCLIGHFY